jgi:hypothetical protein
MSKINGRSEFVRFFEFEKTCQKRKTAIFLSDILNQNSLLFNEKISYLAHREVPQIYVGMPCAILLLRAKL